MGKDQWLKKYQALSSGNILMHGPHYVSISNETWELGTDGFFFTAVKVVDSGYPVIPEKYWNSVKAVLFPEISYEVARPWSVIYKWLQGTDCPTCGHTTDSPPPQNLKGVTVVVDRQKFKGLWSSIPSTLKDTEWVRVEESDHTSTLILTNDKFRAGLCGMMGPTKPFGVTLKDFVAGDRLNAGK